MANNDLLVQSALQSVQSNVTSQSKPVTQSVQTETVTELSVQSQALQKEAEKQNGQQQQLADDLRDKVAQLNDYMQNMNRNLQFSVDDTSGDTVIKVIDSETEEVVRQIPSEEILEARHAAEKYRGILLETKA
ncbi:MULTISPECIES: flagellar protein FlaG [unclassified Methylophaga]|jgi:flagellar protein FlaG|uniref:flagellar protein FlaG n=2 Tax=Methylophaga TaxID=40222 RepID=UPI00259D07D8|nr:MULTISPECIES: flagellar protein FlaG [unclassified Methylophaga]|tara:strand:+ start:1922 stop:2320 length:399 start_codon:yes stop_codon:yes gene_type:complete